MRDIDCPGCEYNLRGLPGPIVTCPECGAVNDIAKLIALRWNGPWHAVPGFERIIFPVFIAVLLPPGLSIPGCIVAGASDIAPWWGLVLGAATSLVVWLPLVVVIHRRGGGEGVVLCLFAHLLLGGYLAVVALVGTAVLSPIAGTFTWVWLIVPGFALGVYCRKGEHFIGRQCVRRYVAGRPF